MVFSASCCPVSVCTRSSSSSWKRGCRRPQPLHAATRGAAELLGQVDERGTVEVGKIADLVLLEANPLADIRNTRRIAAVIDGGVLHSRRNLDQMMTAGASPPVADPVAVTDDSDGAAP